MVKVHPPATAGKGVATGVPPEIATHFGAIVNFLLAAVRAEFRAEREGADADPWVPHTKWPWPRRKSRELAASGVLLGARKLGKLWLARQWQLMPSLRSMASRCLRALRRTMLRPPKTTRRPMLTPCSQSSGLSAAPRGRAAGDELAILPGVRRRHPLRPS